MCSTYGSSPVHDTVNRLSAWLWTRDVCEGYSLARVSCEWLKCAIYADTLQWQGVYTNILLCNTGSGRFTLIYHEDSTERSLDPVEFKRSFLPVDCTLHQAEPWLTFKSWASWLVLKKKCQVIIDRNFCRGKTNTWNLYYPQGRAATEERHLQNNSFLLLVYWSDQTLYHPPTPQASFTSSWASHVRVTA